MQSTEEKSLQEEDIFAITRTWMAVHNITFYFTILSCCKVQAYFGDIGGSVPDHYNKVNMTIKWVRQLLWFPSAYKGYVHTIL